MVGKKTRRRGVLVNPEKEDQHSQTIGRLLLSKNLFAYRSSLFYPAQYCLPAQVHGEDILPLYLPRDKGLLPRKQTYSSAHLGNSAY